MPTIYYMTAGTPTYFPPSKIRIPANPNAPYNLNILTVYRDTTLHGSVTVTGTQTTSTIYLSAAQYDKLAADLAAPGIVQISFSWDGANVTDWQETWQSLPHSISSHAVVALLQQIAESARGALPSATAELIQRYLEVLPPLPPDPEPPVEDPLTNVYAEPSAEPVRLMVEVSVKPVANVSAATTNGKRPKSIALSARAPVQPG